MAEQLTDHAREKQSLLWDLVTAPDEDTAYRGDQDRAVWRLAELLVQQEQRIAALEVKVAELTTNSEGAGAQTLT